MFSTKAFAAPTPAAPLAATTIQRRDVGEHDVLIDVLFCGICHSDLHQVKDDFGGGAFPMVPGHGIVGKVARVGSRVTKFKQGDLVGVGCIADADGTCDECKHDHEECCPNLSYVFLADLRAENAKAAADVMTNAGFDVSTTTVDVSSRESIHELVQAATKLGGITGVVHAAGVSPSQASPKTILAVDLYGTAVLLEEFGNVIARGGEGVVIASQSGHRLGALTAEQDKALATTAPEQLLSLPFLQADQVKDSLHAYQLAKRGNSLRVMAEAVRWGKRGARVNTISPGIIITPLAHDELTGPRGVGYRWMVEQCPVGRAGTPDEVGSVAALLMGPDGAFITGSDFLMDGGVTASYFFGELAPQQGQ